MSSHTPHVHPGTSIPSVAPVDPSARATPEIKIELFQNGQRVTDLETPLTGEYEAHIRILGGSGKHAEVYSHGQGKKSIHLHSDDQSIVLKATGISAAAKKDEIDVTKLFDGEQSISVHLHSMEDGPEDFDRDGFELEELDYVTINGRPAPFGDWKLPDIELMQTRYTDDVSIDDVVRATIIHTAEHGYMLSRLGARVRDDTRGVVNVLPMFGNGVVLPWAYADGYGPPVGRAEYVNEKSKTEVVHTLPVFADFSESVAMAVIDPLLGDKPEVGKIIFQATDSVGRTRFKKGHIRLPAKSKDAVPLKDMPDVRILNLEEFGEVVLPDERENFKFKVRVKIPQSGRYAPANRKALLFQAILGPNAVANVDLIELARQHPNQEYIETEITAHRIPHEPGTPEQVFTGNRAADYTYTNVENRETGLFGKDATTSFGWGHILADDPATGYLVAITPFHHTHLNSVRTEGYLQDTNGPKWSSKVIAGEPVAIASRTEKMKIEVGAFSKYEGTFKAGDQLHVVTRRGREARFTLKAITTTEVLINGGKERSYSYRPTEADVFPTYILWGENPQESFYMHELDVLENASDPEGKLTRERSFLAKPYDPAVQ